MNKRKTGILSLVTYFVIYICLLVPGHLADFAAGHTGPSRSLQCSHTDDSHHDSDACQICLMGGHHSALLFSFSPPVEFNTVSPVEPEKLSRRDCFHVDLISARAPPFSV